MNLFTEFENEFVEPASHLFDVELQKNVTPARTPGAEQKFFLELIRDHRKDEKYKWFILPGSYVYNGDHDTAQLIEVTVKRIK